MSISRKFRIKIKKDVATVNDLVYLYQNDRGIDLLFDIYDYKYLVESKGDMLRALAITQSSITIENSAGNLVAETQRQDLVDNCMLFRVEHEMTDELLEVGKYKLYFHLHDDKGGRITIPPILFEIKKLDTVTTLFKLLDSDGNELLDNGNNQILVRG